MLKLQSIFVLVLFFFGLSFFFFSCEWEEYEVSDIEISEVSFSEDVMPIFNQSCNSIGCHNDTGIPPDLSPANAYQDLFDTNMIDLNNPAQSELYVRMIDVQSPMPLDGILSETLTRTVLVWIEEGALDN
ncbi:MAG: hypothetical protein DWQ02_10555 [Bacteroidetes bacterium]|nr:MAG: hypothetical protein DWQ02_10555 [Bacteroidota bacterium]